MLRDFLLLLVLLAGCAVTYERPDLQPAPEPSGLDLDATVEPLVLNRGDTLFVQLTVTNNSIATIVQHFGSGCIYGFGLWDSEGELVAPPPPVCTMNAPTVRYKPGGVVVRTFEW
ncbi:MAG: hypothetical protein OEO21_11530, partial [Candidatus Krumholzibacteria bacterium]|nr:hypothetical protein [Candidatus Krumholzibacteria bacterium]